MDIQYNKNFPIFPVLIIRLSNWLCN